MTAPSSRIWRAIMLGTSCSEELSQRRQRAESTFRLESYAASGTTTRGSSNS